MTNDPGLVFARGRTDYCEWKDSIRNSLSLLEVRISD